MYVLILFFCSFPDDEASVSEVRDSLYPQHDPGQAGWLSQHFPSYSSHLRHQENQNGTVYTCNCDFIGLSDILLITLYVHVGANCQCVL